jgi:hypothetical protein
MGEHEMDRRPLNRAKFFAWTVAITMAGTTMSYQTYHAITVKHLSWGAGLGYGVVPLLLSLCLLEIAAGWRDSPLAFQIGAWAIMVGAMYLSASATGAVVSPAAPSKLGSNLFGVLLDGSALMAMFFLMHGPGSRHHATAGQVAGQHTLRITQPSTAPAAASRAEVSALPMAHPQAAQRGPEWSILAALLWAGGGAKTGATTGAGGGAKTRAKRGATTGAGGGASGSTGGAMDPGAGTVHTARAESQDPDAIAARKEYTDSLKPGRKTLTDRDLAALHPGRSRNWGKARINEVKRRTSGLHAVPDTGTG